MNIYVGNLAYQVTEEDIREAFESFGPVSSARIITDGFSGKSKGFGFVEMENGSDAEQAITALNGTELKGRAMVVNEARPREPRSDSRGPRRNAGGNGGGYKPRSNNRY